MVVCPRFFALGFKDQQREQILERQAAYRCWVADDLGLANLADHVDLLLRGHRYESDPSEWVDPLLDRLGDRIELA